MQRRVPSPISKRLNILKEYMNILDDLMMGAFNKNVCELFTKGSHHRNLSVTVVTQNIFHKFSHTRDISLNTKGNVKLIACEDERSAALYKAAINKVGEVYPGAKLAVCEAAAIPSRPRARVWLPSEPSEPEAILSLLTRFNPKLSTGGLKVVKVEKTERVKMNVVILLNQACL